MHDLSSKEIRELKTRLDKREIKLAKMIANGMSTTKAADFIGMPRKEALETRKRPHVQEYLDYLDSLLLDVMDITPNRIMAEIAKTAFGSITDVLEVDENGITRVKDFEDLDFPENIKSIDVDMVTGKIKVATHDKLKALDLLATLAGMKVENINLTNNGGDMPKPTVNVAISINSRKPGEQIVKQITE